MQQLGLFDHAPASPVAAPPSHQCAAPGCQVPISLSLLMCHQHWAKVPKLEQLAVWQHYRPGQEEDGRPSAEYLTAAKAAVKSLLPPAAPSAAPEALPLGAAVRIVKEVCGKQRSFIPWQGAVGLYRGLSPAGLALLDFGVPGHLYPVDPSFLELTTL